MRYIFKNYLKTFINNWIQTLGTILFIMMMVTIVIGFLASPLQINTIVKKYQRTNHEYDTFLNVNEKNKTGTFTNDFLYQYVYKDEGFKGKDQKGQEVTLVNPSLEPMLSPIYKVSLDRYLQSNNTTNETQKQTFVGNNLNQAIDLYKQGGLIQLDLDLPLTNAQGTVNRANLNMIIDNLSNLLVTDSKLAMAQNYGTQFNSPEILYRLVMKTITLVTNNGLEIDLNELGGGDGIDDAGNIKINSEQEMKVLVQTLLNRFFDSALKDNPKNINWKLSTFELFSPELYWRLGWKNNNTTSGYEDYSYDFNYYVLSQIFNDSFNRKLYDPIKGFRYQVESEKRLYFAQTTTDSLFPKFAIELKTANLPGQLNQLQLESGSLPTAVRFRDLVNKDRDRAIIPTIVLNSGYFNGNELRLGNQIELPESSALNNLLLPNRQPADQFLMGKIPFKIIGSGSKFDDLVPGRKYTPFLENIDNYANGYVDNALFSIIRNSRWNFSSTNENNYATKFIFKNLWNKNDNVVNELTINFRTGSAVYTTNTFVNFKDSSTLKNLYNIQTMVTIFIILGIVVLILSFVFINFIIKKELNETRRQIGIFKSFGYKISELSWIFAIKTLITIFVGIVVGLIGSIPLQLYAATLYTSNLMFSFAHIYLGVTFLVILLIVIPLIFLAISYFLTLQYLREPTLSLLSSAGKVSKWTSKPSFIIRKLSEKNMWFAYRLQRAFVRRSMGKFVVVQLLFAFASLSYTMLFGAQTLLYALVNQGFSSLNPNTDHEFSWTNKMDLGIGIEDEGFNVNSIDEFTKQNFEYVSYNKNEKIGDILNEDSNTSDGRYRISLVVNSYAREFDTNRHDHALDLLMPEQYYLDKFTSQPNKPPTLTGNNAVKFIYDDYYLNWILTLKITDFPTNMVNNVKNNNPYTFSEIENYVQQHKDMRIDISKAVGGDPAAIAELQKEFPKTIFGMKAVDENGQKNNLFLEDITKIIILQLAEQNFDAQINSWLNKNAVRQPNGMYLRSDVLSAITNVKSSQLGREFNPNDPRYWGINNNPLIDLDSILDNSDEDGNGGSSIEDKIDSVGGGLSLSKLPPETISLIMSALMLQKEPENDINSNSVVTMNQLFFNKDTELLTYEMRLSNNNQTSGRTITDWINLRLFDSQSSEFGTYNNLLSHGGVSNETYRHLADPIIQNENTINGILPYGLARTYKIKVGDQLTLLTDTINRQEITINVIGINEDVSFTLGTGWPIDVDYGQFRAKFFDPELTPLFDEGWPIFNKLYSQEALLTGNINVNDIAQSINTMKFVGKNLSMSIDNNAAIFGTVFNGMIDFSRLFNSNIDPDFLLITNPNVASTSRKSTVIPYNILRSGADNVIGIVNNVLILFMFLLAALLLIILVVVMNIVVEEAAQIILTLRAIGYSNFEVNWIVMGSYIVGALISFVVAYIMSLVIWIVFLEIVGNLTHIYVFMRFSWQAPVITFFVIGTILVIGWAAANSRVNKTPLPRITNFA